MAKDTQVTVVMVPFLAQGHLGQLLHLSRLISSYDIPVHYVSTTTHIRQASSRHQGWDLLAHDNIHVHEFPIPGFHCPAPDPNAKIKYPTQLQPAFDASVHLREPLFELVTSLSATARRVVIIHDYLMASVVQDFVSVPNAESYIFQSTNAFFFYSFYWDLMGRPTAADSDILQQLPSLQGCLSPESIAFGEKQQIHLKNSSGELYNTSRAIEGHYFDLLHQLQVDKKQWAIGPFNPVDIFEKPDHQRHGCLKWLDNQASNSVIYVSFGTTTCLSDEQIQAIAVGLENSGQKFIWVLRDADKGDIFTRDVRKSDLPMGYEDRILEARQGMIVRGWAPQLEILAHASTGGFMSHCGWNSCLESMSMGVPIATWPMHSDQPRNAVLITKVLKLGIVVKDWTPGNDLVESLHIENAVKKLIASKEGDEIRKRAVALRIDIKKSVAKGGVSRLELDSFIDHITRSN
ncbi:Glycosyltransferase [Heracleum sosnowskyi]|uniref:Glycosyltransferase n=1 Tax=Heracleum sosnowskyi TaxID=360622 RepID=A0AAD8J4J4_9APIA|nr:Glycosyltransferase [Heracleum sosnowskyi]